MSLIQGQVLPGEGLTSKFQVVIPGTPPLACPAVGELERKVSQFIAEDGTTRSGARLLPGSTTLSIYAHHETERAAIMEWARQAETSAPGYKRDILIHVLNGQLTPVLSTRVRGAWCESWKTPAGDASADGEAVKIELSIQYDTCEIA